MRRRRRRIEYPDELYHFGIKGMKWGVRRFQRKDGTLTPKGKARNKGQDKKRLTPAEREARNAKIKKYAKRAAIGVGVTAAALGAGYLAYKNRGNLQKLNSQNAVLKKTLENSKRKGRNNDSVIAELKKQEGDLNRLLKDRKESNKKLDSIISSAEERLRNQSTYGDPRLDAIAKRQQFRVVRGGLNNRTQRTPTRISKAATNRLRTNQKNIRNRAADEFVKAMSNPYSVMNFGGDPTTAASFYDSRDPQKKSITPTWDSHTYGPRIKKVRKAIKSVRRR